MSKILLTALVKDDTEFEILDRMLKSFMPYMSGLLVLANGMSGKFLDIERLIKQYKGHLIKADPKSHPYLYSQDEGGIFFSNFAKARTALFEYADDNLKGYDWYTWADTDDLLLNGEQLDPLADKAKELKLDAVFMTYWYSVRVKEDGSFNEGDVQIDHDRERLLKPGIFKWTSRLHEIAVVKEEGYKPKINVWDYNPKEERSIVWAHITTKDKSTDNMIRNLRILELQAREENNKDPRTLFYIAKTYYDLNTPEKDEKAIQLLTDYRELSGWAEERANSWEYTANIFARQGKHKVAINALHEGLKEFPNRHMFYLLLAKEYAEVNMFEQSDFWLDTVLRMDPPRSRTTIGNPLEIKFMSASLKYNQAIRNTQLEDAIMWMKKRLEYGGLKDDGMLKTLEESKALNDAAKNVVLYAKWLRDNKHEKLIQPLLSSLPYELGREQFAYVIQNDIKEGKKWPRKSIAYLASWGTTHFEGWSPKNMDTGIGGSETAVIELAKRWVKMGFDVTVFGDPRDDEGDYEGVHYRPWYHLNWKDEFDTLILWRSPHLLDKEIKARQVLLDLHDVSSNLDYTPERVKKLTKVFFKSKYHREMVPNIPDDKAVVISNGI